MVIHAGHGQDSDPKNTDLLWASAYRSGLDATCGAKRFDHGGSVAEVVSEESGGGLHLGGFTHEFGHTIGLPDLYNTDPEAPDDFGMDYVGLWSLMAAGSWGGPDNDGSAPTGLEAWTRTKLGWLLAELVSVEPDAFVQTLDQIGDTSGPRALQLKTEGKSYCLIEVREKIGVDKYLPDSGVLITRIDEAKGSGKGVVKVVDCHPGTETIDDATCEINESWQDKENSIYVKVIGEQGTSYTIAVASEPVTVVQISVVVEPIVAGITVTIDGVTYDSNQLPLDLIWAIGSTHDLQIHSAIDNGYGVRYVFVQWSDGSESASQSVKVTQSVTYVAKFKVECLLTVNSPTGDPHGTGWYEKDSLATFSVASPSPAEGLLGMLGGKYMFDHWSGDSTATTSSASVLMDGPKVVTAEWRTDNTMPYIIIAAIGAVLIATVALLVLKRRRKTPSSTTASQPPIGPILHVEPAPYPTSQERLETQRH